LGRTPCWGRWSGSAGSGWRGSSPSSAPVAALDASLNHPACELASVCVNARASPSPRDSHQGHAFPPARRTMGNPVRHESVCRNGATQGRARSRTGHYQGRRLGDARRGTDDDAFGATDTLGGPRDSQRRCCHLGRVARRAPPVNGNASEATPRPHGHGIRRPIQRIGTRGYAETAWLSGPEASMRENPRRRNRAQTASASCSASTGGSGSSRMRRRSRMPCSFASAATASRTGFACLEPRYARPR
jgi:hypothetical protein